TITPAFRARTSHLPRSTCHDRRQCRFVFFSGLYPSQARSRDLRSGRANGSGTRADALVQGQDDGCEHVSPRDREQRSARSRRGRTRGGRGVSRRASEPPQAVLRTLSPPLRLGRLQRLSRLQFHSLHLRYLQLRLELPPPEGGLTTPTRSPALFCSPSRHHRRQPSVVSV